jgi:hypothetical protein
VRVWLRWLVAYYGLKHWLRWLHLRCIRRIRRTAAFAALDALAAFDALGCSTRWPHSMRWLR